MLLSGGRCELCGKAVLISSRRDMDNEDSYNFICEIAHIYGLNEKSPRYDKDKQGINEPNNLMILCPNCHKRIDKEEKAYPVEELQKKKLEFERGTVNSISELVNQTNIGGHEMYKNGQKLLNYFATDNPKLNKLESLDELETVSDVEYEIGVRKLILSLNDLNIDSRIALLNISESRDSDYRLSLAYWNSAYGEQIRTVLDPLEQNYYISASDVWSEDDDSSAKLEVSDEWNYLIDFLLKNEIPLEKLIIDRNYTVIDC